jgi:hypothetical protein
VKPWIQISAAVIVGAIIGFGAAPFMQKRWLGNELQAIASKVYSAHDYAGPVSLPALTELEAGQPEKAKVSLAREVAAW